MPLADEFTIVHSVPIVDTFSDRGVVLDDKFLDDMILDANKRQQETGDMPPVIVGHNPDEPVPETEKPPVIGFVRNLRKDRLGNTDRNAAFGDLWIYKGQENKLKQFPRRSAELFPSLKRLDALAVLGATAPQRDLGLTAPLKLKREVPVEDEKKAMPAEEPKGLAEIMDMLKQIMSLIQSQAPAPAGASDEDAELEKLLAELGGEAEPEKETEETKEKETEVKLSRRLAEMEAKVATAEIREQLLKLQRDGILLDVESETAELVKLDPEMRKVMLSRIEKNYAKAPVQTKPLAGLEDSKGQGESKTLSKEQRTKILQLARQSNYETAFAEVMGQTTSQYFGSK